jgi:hypothetical protein
MSMLNLSNLHVRPNLLSAENYQQEMMRCSVFELRDIKERNPNLFDGMPPSKQAEWRDSLFWGDSPPKPVPPAWAEQLAGGLSEAVRDLEERPTLEAAIECLILARQLYHTRPDGPARAAAAEWDRRVCLVLARDEFRHTPDMVDQRVENILGRRLTGPPLPAVALSEPPPPPNRPAVRPRQPALFPLVADSRTEASTEPVAVDRCIIPQSSPAVANAVSVAEPPAVLPSPLAEDKVSRPNGMALLPAAESPTRLYRGEAKPHGATPTAAPPEKPADVRQAPAAPPRPTTTLTVRDPDLKRLVQRWATLPDHVKKCVMMLLDASEATQNNTNE